MVGIQLLSKIEELCPLAIPNQTSTVSMHMPSLVKIIDIYSRYCLEMKILTCDGQITLSKINKICPLAIQNLISIISMHIPNLLKIHLHLLKLSSGIKNTDKGTDRKMDRPIDVQCEIIVPCHYCVSGYQKKNYPTMPPYGNLFSDFPK